MEAGVIWTVTVPFSSAVAVVLPGPGPVGGDDFVFAPEPARGVDTVVVGLAALLGPPLVEDQVHELLTVGADRPVGVVVGTGLSPVIVRPEAPGHDALDGLVAE